MKNIYEILIIIGCIAILIFIFDLYISFSIWFKRIHIGKYQDREEWQSKIEGKAKKWIAHAPKIKLTDQSRFLLWDIIRGKYTSSTIQSWQYAGLLFGMDKDSIIMYLKTHRKAFNFKKMKVDFAFIAYVLNKNDMLSDENKNSLIKYFQSFQNNTIPYRIKLPDIRFVDTIGMICPFLYSIDMKDLALRQIEEYDKILLEDVFPPHAFNITYNYPLGIYDWSRGIGWYILGITQTTPLEGNVKRVINLSDKLLELQSKDGGFTCMIFNSNERFESSGTALIGILFIKAYELTNDEKYLKAALRVETSLMCHTRRDGAIDFAQGDTKGIGFYSTKFGIMPFAQGMSLYLSKQLDKYLS